MRSRVNTATIGHVVNTVVEENVGHDSSTGWHSSEGNYQVVTGCAEGRKRYVHKE